MTIHTNPMTPTLGTVAERIEDSDALEPILIEAARTGVVYLTIAASEHLLMERVIDWNKREADMADMAGEYSAVQYCGCRGVTCEPTVTVWRTKTWVKTDPAPDGDYVLTLRLQEWEPGWCDGQEWQVDAELDGLKTERTGR